MPFSRLYFARMKQFKKLQSKRYLENASKRLTLNLSSGNECKRKGCPIWLHISHIAVTPTERFKILLNSILRKEKFPICRWMYLEDSFEWNITMGSINDSLDLPSPVLQLERGAICSSKWTPHIFSPFLSSIQMYYFLNEQVCALFQIFFLI